MSFFSTPITQKPYDLANRLQTNRMNGQNPVSGQKPAEQETLISFAGKKNADGSGSDPDTKKLEALSSLIAPKPSIQSDFNQNFDTVKPTEGKSISFGGLSNKTDAGNKPNGSYAMNPAFRGDNTVNHYEKPPEIDQSAQTATADAASRAMANISNMQNLTPTDKLYKDKAFMTFA